LDQQLPLASAGIEEFPALPFFPPDGGCFLSAFCLFLVNKTNSEFGTNTSYE